MKGLVLYSSSTGNTKRMGEYLFEKLGTFYYMDIQPVNHCPNLENYDFILLGGWINKGHIDRKSKRVFKNFPKIPTGIFATLGALPQSEHGLEVQATLEKMVPPQYSLGVYLCPGIVDPKLIKGLEGGLGTIVPKKIREGILCTSYESRPATEAELEEGVAYFCKNLELKFK